MAFDIAGARAAGYNDDDIADYLGGQRGIDTKAARAAGWTTPDLMGELSDAWAKKALPYGVKPAVGTGAGRGNVNPPAATTPVPAAGLASIDQSAARTGTGLPLRRGGTRAEAQPFAGGDVRVVDPAGSPAQDDTALDRVNGGRDVMLNPAFVDKQRALYANIPEDKRLGILTEAAKYPGVQGRADKLILDDVLAENQQADDALRNKPVFSAAAAKAPAAFGAGKSGRVPMPDLRPRLGNLVDSPAMSPEDVDPRRLAQASRMQSGGRVVAAADGRIDAVADRAKQSDQRGLSLQQSARDLMGGIEQVKALGAGAAAYGGSLTWQAQTDALKDMDAIDDGGAPAGRAGGVNAPARPTDIARMYQDASPEARAKMRDLTAKRLMSSQDFIGAAVKAVGEYNTEQERLSGKMPEFTDIASVRDFAVWAVRNGIATSPTMAVSMVGALAGGVPGLIASSSAMAVGDMSSARAEFAGKNLDPKRFHNPDRAATASAQQGELTAGYMAKNAGATTALAVPYVALDFLGPAATLAKKGIKGLARVEGRSFLRTAGKEGGEEIINEGGQEIVNITSDMAAGERSTRVTGADANRVVNAAAVGGLIGVGGHAANVGMAAARDATVNVPARQIAAAIDQYDPMQGLHSAIDTVAQRSGLGPRATAALRDAVVNMAPEQAVPFVERALAGFERRGIFKRAGAITLFRQAMQPNADAASGKMGQQQPGVGSDVGLNVEASAPENPPVAAPAEDFTGLDTPAVTAPQSATPPADEPFVVGTHEDGTPVIKAGDYLRTPDGQLSAEPGIPIEGAANGADAAGTGGQRAADARRGAGAGLLPDGQPGDLPAGTGEPAGKGQPGGGAAGLGAGDPAALNDLKKGLGELGALFGKTPAAPAAAAPQTNSTPPATKGNADKPGPAKPEAAPGGRQPAVGESFDMDGKRWTFDKVGSSAVTMRTADGEKRVVTLTSKTWLKIKAALAAAPLNTEAPVQAASGGAAAAPVTTDAKPDPKTRDELLAEMGLRNQAKIVENAQQLAAKTGDDRLLKQEQTRLAAMQSTADAKPAPTAPRIEAPAPAAATAPDAAATRTGPTSVEADGLKPSNIDDTSTSASFGNLPASAQQAIGEHHMGQVTNRKVHPGLINAEWEKVTVPIESLKAKNREHFEDDKQREYAARQIYNSGPAVLDNDGELIDGNHRFNKAIRDGHKTIEVYRPVASATAARSAGGAVGADGVKASVDAVVQSASLKPINPTNDSQKLRQLVQSMQDDGWQGRPVLVWRHGKTQQALTGSHRLAAAKAAGISVPVIYVDEKAAKWDDPRGGFGQFKAVVNEGEDRIAAFLRQAGDLRSADLMRDEFAQSTEPGTSSKAELDAALRGPSNAAAPVQAGSGGAAPAPVAAAPSVKEAPRSTRKKEALASALVLQNRDRSTPASISQMQSIAARPDYTRLGFSRDFTNGAPVVAGGQISPDRLGRADTVAAGDRKIKVRYAVVEAGDVLASNDAGGTTNASYATDASRTRAIAGNGRIAGLQAAYQRKTGAGYRQALLDDDLHGVPRNTVQAMTAPVLVRVMSEADVTGDIGDVSNTAGTLALSAGEQARNDGRRVALDALEFTEDGAITPATMRRFVQGMPQAEQGALIDATGAPTRQAVDRLNGAIFAAAYDSDALVSLYTQATDPEARNIMSALAQAAPSMARLKGAGALDIRDLVTQAAEQAVNARRRGIKLADMAAQQDIDTDLAVARVLQLFAQNARTVAPVVEALRRAADFAHNEATKGGADMFGAVERADRAQVLEKLGDGDERRSTQGVGNQAGRRPAGQDAGGQAIATSGPADAASIEAGRPADQQPASGASPAPELTLAAQTADDLKAKTERETAATEAAQRKRALEQERLRREAEARDNKARADQTVDSFELGQDAGRQMSGMGDMFDAPATNKESLTVAPAAADVAPDPLATPEAFDGKTITQQVQVADTGKTATLRMDAGQALRDVNEREAALLKLKACMGR